MAEKKETKRIVKFCETNVKVTNVAQVINILKNDYRDVLEVRIVDCFKRCLECRKKPFCRIQLHTIESSNSKTLVEQIIQSISR